MTKTYRLVSKLTEIVFFLTKKKSTHSVPLSHHSFFLELGELPPVVNGRQQFPQQQQCQSHEHHSTNHPKNDSQHVYLRWAISLFLHLDLVLFVRHILIVGVVIRAVLIVVNMTANLLVVDVNLKFFYQLVLVIVDARIVAFELGEIARLKSVT